MTFIFDLETTWAGIGAFLAGAGSLLSSYAAYRLATRRNGEQNLKLATLIVTGSLLAAGTGYLASEALSGSSATPPSTTTTITVKDGEPGATGPTGPQGPKGEPGAGGGAEACPAGSVFGELVINHPGGQVSILTCIKETP